MSEMPISEAREHISELVGRARYGHEPTILTHYGRPAAVVISFEEYQRLKQAAEEVPEYQLPPEIEAIVEESRRHPERDQPRPRRAGRRAH
jgi:prevent-host-death family protein